jgi:hypothetical protein
MDSDVLIRQTIPEHLCDAVLSWTLCAYYVDPLIVSVVVLVAAAVAIFVYLHKKKHDSKNLG